MLLRPVVGAALFLLAGCASGPAAPIPAVSRPGPVIGATNATLQGLPQRSLAVHNVYRAAVGAPPLQWNTALAAAAQDYARHLAATGRFAHSERTSRPGQGENLWMGTSGAYRLETMLNHWGEERAQFRPGVFPNVSRTGNWADVAHFTQIIWPTTTQVGCAIATGRGNDYLVCRYSPPGNRDGHPVP